jgi:hypothetical protein
MTTATAASMKETFESLSPDSDISSLIIDSLIQTIHAETSSSIDSQVLAQGKVNSRPTPKAKVIPVVSADALVGDNVYTRPNGEQYHARKWGEHDDVMVLRKARMDQQFNLLYGAPGCGKTALVEAAYEDLYTIMGTGDTELADFIGGYVQTPTGGFVWEDGPLVKAAEQGVPLLIDEIGLIDPKVLSGVYGLMDGRKELTITANPERGTIKAKDGFYVVAATNPNAPGVRLSEALLSRFIVQTEMTTDWSLAKKLGASAQIVTVAQNINRRQASGECGWCPQMRELLAFRDISKSFGTKFAIANLIACAPELDRPVVADVLTRVYGEECRPAKI